MLQYLLRALIVAVFLGMVAASGQRVREDQLPAAPDRDSYGP